MAHATPEEATSSSATAVLRPEGALAVSASLNVGTWLFIGGIAQTSASFQDRGFTMMLVAACCLIQLYATGATIVNIDASWPGMVGFGVAAFLVFPLLPLGVGTIFWILGAMYFGLLVELVAGPVSRLTRGR